MLGPLLVLIYILGALGILYDAIRDILDHEEEKGDHTETEQNLFILAATGAGVIIALTWPIWLPRAGYQYTRDRETEDD